MRHTVGWRSAAVEALFRRTVACRGSQETQGLGRDTHDCARGAEMSRSTSTNIRTREATQHSACQRRWPLTHHNDAPATALASRGRSSSTCILHGGPAHSIYGLHLHASMLARRRQASARPQRPPLLAAARGDLGGPRVLWSARPNATIRTNFGLVVLYGRYAPRVPVKFSYAGCGQRHDLPSAMAAQTWSSECPCSAAPRACRTPTRARSGPSACCRSPGSCSRPSACGPAALRGSPSTSCRCCVSARHTPVNANQTAPLGIANVLHVTPVLGETAVAHMVQRPLQRHDVR